MEITAKQPENAMKPGLVDAGSLAGARRLGTLRAIAANDNVLALAKKPQER